MTTDHPRRRAEDRGGRFARPATVLHVFVAMAVCLTVSAAIAIGGIVIVKDQAADQAARDDRESAVTNARNLISGDLTRDDFVSFVGEVVKKLTPGEGPQERRLVRRIRAIGHDFFPDRRCIDLEASTPAICAQARTEVLRQRALQGQPPRSP